MQRVIASSSCLLGVLGLLTFACGDPGASGPAGPAGPAGASAEATSGGPGSAPDAASPGEPVPQHAPSGIAFVDEAAACSKLAGKVVISRAGDERDVTSYALYFGRSATEKLYLSPIVTLPATGNDPAYQFFDEGVPLEATHLLAFSANSAGEMPTGVAIPLIERRAARYHAIGAGSGVNTGYLPSAIIDETNGKLLVAAMNLAGGGKLGLFRCDLDGSRCTHVDISAGQATNSGQSPAITIDPVHQKLLVVTTNASANGGNKPSLFRCNLDGTSCTHTDISTGLSSSGFHPSVVVDTVNDKLLAVTMNSSTGSRPSLFRCNLDGTSCTHTDISAGQGNGSGEAPFALIDEAAGKLLVITTNIANGRRASLFRCNLDGTSCTHTDISAGQGEKSGQTPSAVIDTESGKLLVVTRNDANSLHASLFRCELDGTSCTHTDITAAQPALSGYKPSVAIDRRNGALVVATSDGARDYRPSLFRCAMDGTACTFADLSDGQGVSSGSEPNLLIDGTTGAYLVVTANGADDARPALFSICGR